VAIQPVKTHRWTRRYRRSDWLGTTVYGTTGRITQLIGDN
jgi:hypothetical protein